MSESIKDKVAIVGMGCTKFSNHHDKDLEDLVTEAAEAALKEANLTIDDIDAFYFGSVFSGGMSGLILGNTLKIKNKPITRVENYCATGSETVRNAAYAVASGTYDVVMAIGVDKLNDTGYSGLVGIQADDRTEIEMTAPAQFSLLAGAYCDRFGVSYEDMRKALVRVAYKSHYNGSFNPKAMFRKHLPEEVIAKSPLVAAPYLTVMDCSGISDGAAAAIVTRSDVAAKYTDTPMYIKAAQLVHSDGGDLLNSDYDFTELKQSAESARLAYKEAAVTDPLNELDLIALHDCFTITEIVLYEALQLSKPGEGWKDVLDGKFDKDGKIPVNIDGGLKSFGHPVAASGIRMLYEMWLQFRGEAGQRQLENPKLGATHNLGGAPQQHLSSFMIVGKELG